MMLNETIAYNASVIAGITTIQGILPIVVITFFISIVLGLALSFNFYKRFRELFSWLGMTFEYFIYGMFALLVLGLMYYLSTMAAGTISENWEAVLGYGIAIIIGYFAISGFGYIIAGLIKKLDKNEAKMKRKD